MRKISALMSIGLLSVALLSACSGEKTDATENVEDDKVKVSVALVTSRPVAQIEEFTATVEPEVKNNIAPSMPVRIEKITVEVGTHVKKGQPLVHMDNAGLIQSKLQLQNKEIEFQRIDELYKVGGVSKSEWDALKMSLDVANSSYQNLVENTVLLSPINGVITARNYDNGDMYSGGAPVLTIEQITPVKLTINVSETYFTKLKQGMPATIKLDVFGEEEFTGKISLIYPTIDENSRTFQVEITLPNTNQRVRPGMFGRVTFNLGTLDHVVIPDRAIVKQTGSGERFVYLYNDGKVSFQKIELGRRLGDEYELIEGVPSGSQVVTAGQSRLRDGMEVTVK